MCVFLFHTCLNHVRIIHTHTHKSHLYGLKQGLVLQNPSWQQIIQLFWHSVFCNRRQGWFCPTWHEFPRLKPQSALLSVCGNKAPLLSARGSTIVILLKETGGPCHHCFCYILSPPWVACQIYLAEAQNLTDFIVTFLGFFSVLVCVCVLFLIINVKNKTTLNMRLEYMFHGFFFKIDHLHLGYWILHLSLQLIVVWEGTQSHLQICLYSNSKVFLHPYKVKQSSHQNNQVMQNP